MGQRLQVRGALMKHSLFDKIFLGFLFLSLALFGLLVFYSTYATKKALVEDRTAVLTNEAFLISEQAVANYLRGTTSFDDLQNSLDYYSDTLNSSVWYANKNGIVVASANISEHPKPPKNILFLSQDFDLTTYASFTDNFFDHFNNDVIAVCIPIAVNGNPNGMVFVFATISQIGALQQNTIQVVYLPFLVMLTISFLLLGLISSKIMKPIKLINTTAQEYSMGNFETKTGITTHDEIGQLAQTLEYMASELSKLEEYRRDFISNISHDFRSPLTSIKGYVEAMLDGTIPPEKQEKYLRIVLSESKRLTKLTTDMLELDKFESYGPWVTPVEFDVLSIIDRAIDSFGGKCKDKGISLILKNRCSDTLVKADRSKIHQVVYNLIDNAIKFTPAGKNIYIVMSDNNDKLFVSIKDEGTGIPPDALKKIWVRFYKSDTSRGKDKGGTGLGLSIVREIIKSHNETIDVVSTVGIGSTFTFSLTKVNPKQTDIED